MQLKKSLALILTGATAAQAHVNIECRCTDLTDPCWPDSGAWGQLNASVEGRLITGAAAGSPVQACAAPSSDTQACALALNRTAATEFWNMKFVGGFQSTGLNQGFSVLPSEYAVAAASAADVQAAIRFASRHNLRVVVKGAGHDYMGRNTATAPGSLLISTQSMKRITWAEDNKTVTVEAGTVWQDVFIQAQARGRFVLGGHCPSVGAAGGFSLGAGYGPLSRYYGTGADNMLSATVVTAGGDVVVANATSNADLFWALRGGGGGTFGIATTITYKTYAAPTLGGYVRGTVSCPDEASFEKGLGYFLAFLTKLFTPAWGGSVNPDGAQLTLGIGLSYLEMSQADAEAVWEPFVKVVGTSVCSWRLALSFEAMPTIVLPDGSKIIHNYPYQGGVFPNTGDPKVDAREVDGFLTQLNQYSFGQAHRYIPAQDFYNFPDMVAKKLVNITKFKTSYRVLQLSKALWGGGNSGENVSANPAARAAGVALMCNEHVANYFPSLPETRETLWNMVEVSGVRGFFDGGLCASPDKSFAACLTPAVQTMDDSQVQACWSGIHQCFDHRSAEFHGTYVPALREAFPTGSYANEGDYFETDDWQHMFWGANYPRLAAVKHQVDPAGLFVCHNCVGSEDWTLDGNCRVPTLGRHEDHKEQGFVVV